MLALYRPAAGKSSCGMATRGASIDARTMPYNRRAGPRIPGHTGDGLASLLPLFPLDLVLFPGTPLPLHIFEPALQRDDWGVPGDDSPFGVVRATEQGMAEIGCTAENVVVTRKYPDGRMDIITEGRRPSKCSRSTATVHFSVAK